MTNPDSFLSNAHPAYLEGLYERYRDQPEQLDPSWQHFFAGFSLARQDPELVPAGADADSILKEIAAGAKKAGKKEGKDLHLILNREEAIGFAMTQAKSKDDVVVLLGKGHEKTIERADGEYPWNEADVARAALQALNTSNQASK